MPGTVFWFASPLYGLSAQMMPFAPAFDDVERKPPGMPLPICGASTLLSAMEVEVRLPVSAVDPYGVAVARRTQTSVTCARYVSDEPAT